MKIIIHLTEEDLHPAFKDIQINEDSVMAPYHFKDIISLAYWNNPNVAEIYYNGKRVKSIKSIK